MASSVSEPSPRTSAGRVCNTPGGVGFLTLLLAGLTRVNEKCCLGYTGMDPMVFTLSSCFLLEPQ